MSGKKDKNALPIQMDKQKKRQIGSRAKQVRSSMGMSQEAFSEALGVTQNHVSNIETGKSAISTEMLLRYCEVCEVTADYLLFGSEHSRPQVDAFLAWACRLSPAEQSSLGSICHGVRQLKTAD